MSEDTASRDVVAEYISGVDSPQREVIEALRALIIKEAAIASETVKWGQPATLDAGTSVTSPRKLATSNLASSEVRTYSTLRVCSKGLLDEAHQSPEHARYPSQHLRFPHQGGFRTRPAAESDELR